MKNLHKSIEYIKVFIFTFITLYIIGTCSCAFISLSLAPFNMLEWGEFGRTLYLFLSTIISLFICSSMYDDMISKLKNYDKEMKKY